MRKDWKVASTTNGSMSFERCRRFQDRSDARRMQGGRRACGKGAAHRRGAVRRVMSAGRTAP
ncbi:hypothetical protein A8H31_01555 [Burkholderia thailandensis]|nr:hypothetical protein A8H31_01555 [Burkholderia thailandensis]